MSFGPGRFEALLAHQGPLVHVDHSHRAPAPTGEDCHILDFLCQRRQALAEEKERRARDEARDKIRARIFEMGLAEEGAPGTHWIPVKAGAVRKFLETRRYKQQKVQYIKDHPLKPFYTFDVKFLIDEDSNVRYIILPSGYSLFDEGVNAGGQYQWSKEQDEQYLYAPNEKLKYVLETAANKLFEMPPQ